MTIKGKENIQIEVLATHLQFTNVEQNRPEPQIHVKPKNKIQNSKCLTKSLCDYLRLFLHLHKILI